MSSNREEQYILIQTRSKESNILLREEFRNHAGERDRGGLPSLIVYDPKTGKPNQFMYHKNGILHREDGPAHYQIKVENNVVFWEGWYQNGELHREDGRPSDIYRDENTGIAFTLEHYFNGERVTPSLSLWDGAYFVESEPVDDPTDIKRIKNIIQQYDMPPVYS